MSQGDSIGMMEGAFFVSRSELLSWINDLLQLNIQKVEQMATGAAYIQIMDAIYPGTVPMHKVNWNAKYPHEFVNNYKILQQIFATNQIQRHIDVEKLIKQKYQDNLEFTQWLKRYFDLNFRGGDYNAVERRRGAKTPWDVGDRRVAPGKTAPKPRVAERPAQQVQRQKQPTVARSAAVDNSKVLELEKQVEELHLTADNLVKERDFYFGKLRAIELFCEQFEGNQDSSINEIMKILYATDDQQITVNENGTVTVDPGQDEDIPAER